MKEISPTYQVIREADSNDFDVVCSEHNIKKEADEAFDRVNSLDDNRTYYIEKTYSANIVQVNDLIEWRNHTLKSLNGVAGVEEIIGRLDRLMGLNK